FNFQWSKPFGPHVYNLDRFQDILRAPNGDLIGIGERGPYFIDNNYYRKGWIMRFNAEGDSLWDWVGKAPVINPGPHFFSGGDMLSSGSIIAAGSGTLPNTYSICWLVKISPDGCVDTFFCHPVASPVSEIQKENAGIKVFPNPASEQARVVIPDADFLGGYLEVFDVSAFRVFRKRIESQEERLDVRGYLPGVYQVRCFSRDSRKTEAVRLVVMRR
ncbi:MAG: T9SS type A sorting domain-containing protein, partial [Saprospiraceae bacterium]|nr:T9SS type A sorting domain-containing protein [Saprospiraceae bacterium]